MRRSTGAIFFETRPATIITSACRGLARKASAPNRATSLRGAVIAIISMAQQARPNVAGHRLDFRAQFTSQSSFVVMTSGSALTTLFSRPIASFSTYGSVGATSLLAVPLENALLPNVDEAGE